jgi:hypothetical protein
MTVAGLTLANKRITHFTSMPKNECRKADTQSGMDGHVV